MFVLVRLVAFEHDQVCPLLLVHLLEHLARVLTEGAAGQVQSRRSIVCHSKSETDDTTSTGTFLVIF